MDIDLVLISTRRHELLERTLSSFSKMVFPAFNIKKTIVNIDPLWGNEADHQKTVELVNSYFETSIILEPETPNFCAAVKRAWQNTSADFVLHLEEDWLALEVIVPSNIEKAFSTDVEELSLMNIHKNWNGKQVYHYRRYQPWYLPFKIEDLRKPIFSTSPSFWRGQFLRQCAFLMNDEFDPEKQFYSGVNNQLETFVSGKKCKFLIGKSSPNLVEDIGRDWHKQNNIRKTIKNTKSIWEDL